MFAGCTEHSLHSPARLSAWTNRGEPAFLETDVGDDVAGTCDDL